MDGYHYHKVQAREFRRRLLVWQARTGELRKDFDRIERLYRRAFGDEGIAGRAAPLTERVDALAAALDLILSG